MAIDYVVGDTVNCKGIYHGTAEIGAAEDLKVARIFNGTVWFENAEGTGKHPVGYLAYKFAKKP